LEREDKGYAFYKTVILHFNYSAEHDRYLEQAIVELEGIAGGNTLHIEDTLIKTEKRALRVAEARLTTINVGDGTTDLRYGWYLVRLDGTAKEWSRDIKALESRGIEIQRRLFGE
jgi:hypothetical protein